MQTKFQVNFRLGIYEKCNNSDKIMTRKYRINFVCLIRREKNHFSLLFFINHIINNSLLQFHRISSVDNCLIIFKTLPFSFSKYTAMGLLKKGLLFAARENVYFHTSLVPLFLNSRFVFSEYKYL